MFYVCILLLMQAVFMVLLYVFMQMRFGVCNKLLN